MTYLMGNIQNSDAELQAALAAIKKDKRVDGIRVYFEKGVTLLLLVDLVSKRWKTCSGPSATISTTDGDNIKAGIGKYGVALRFHE